MLNENTPRSQERKGSLKDEDEDSGLEDNKPKFEKNEQQSSINQYSEPDDYFSFFSSHEKLLLRPEKSFKHLRSFIKYLPVDYYVLLQENFDTKTSFVESNYVMFKQLPLITRNLTKFQKYVYRQLIYEDISRCTEFKEIEEILNEEYAIEELKQQLNRYGEVEGIELFNFNKKEISSMIARATPKPTKDEMYGFDKMMQRIASAEEVKSEGDEFEDVLRLHRHEMLRKLQYNATKSNADIAKGYLDLTEQQKEEIAASVFKKGKQMKNLNKGIFINGLFRFKDYESKLQFMMSSSYKFGMKFYDQQKNIHFADADFANTLSIQSAQFDNQPLSHA